MNHLQPARADILGVPITAQRFNQAVETVIAWAQQPSTRYICTCPVYTLMLSREMRALCQAIRGAAMVAADGMPVVWVQRRWGYPFAERVYGPDLLQAVCEQGTDLRHYFLGGRPGVTNPLIENLRRRTPALQVAGTSAPHVEIANLEAGAVPDAALVEDLNAAEADIIWIGFGSPKQDLWMASYRPALRAPLLIGVGAAFDFLSGAKSQAPRWMQHAGLEWIFRLATEPRRLWRRYFVYNPRFLWQVARSDIRRKHNP